LLTGSLLASLILCSCGKKPEAPMAPPTPAPSGVTVDGAATGDPAPPPPPEPAAPVEAAVEVAKGPIIDTDPVTKQQRQEMEYLNRSLQSFIAKNQRLPKDFTEFAQSLEGLPLPPVGKYWIIDPASKSIKLASRK
jgi:hypothetical protein